MINEKLNDFELVLLAQEKNEDAIKLLYEKYRPIIVTKSKYALSFANHHGIDIEDVMQEGFLGLDEAIKDFVQENDATFYTFANLCIDRQITNYIKKIKTSRHSLLNNALTLDENLEKVISDSTNIEEDILVKDMAKETLKNLEGILTKFEFKVLKLKSEGYSFEKIAE